MFCRFGEGYSFLAIRVAFEYEVVDRFSWCYFAWFCVAFSALLRLGFAYSVEV